MSESLPRRPARTAAAGAAAVAALLFAVPLAAVAAAAGGGVTTGAVRLAGAAPGTNAAWAAGDGAAAARIAVAAARAELGQPYVWGGGDATGPTGGLDHVSPPGFDCSGLTRYAWAQVGVGLPHLAAAQYDLGLRVPVGQARTGDLIFLATDPTDPTTIHHVAMVAGPAVLIEAQDFGVPVHIRPFAGPAEPEIMPYAVRLAP